MPIKKVEAKSEVEEKQNFSTKEMKAESEDGRRAPQPRI